MQKGDKMMTNRPMRHTSIAARFAIAALTTATLLIIAAPAQAEEHPPEHDTYRGTEFTPELTVCTSGISGTPCTFTWIDVDDVVPGEMFMDLIFAGSTRAGANPDLTVRMSKTPDHCPNYGPDCERDQDPLIYIEQNVQRMTTHLPPGLAPDANAAPYCDPVRKWRNLEDDYKAYEWSCKNPDAFVGAIKLSPTQCDYANANFHCMMFNEFLPLGTFIPLKGFIYNAKPRPGEQGHLIVLLLMDTYAVRDDPKAAARTDISITVSDDLSMTATAEIPDPLSYIKGDHGTECDGIPVFEIGGSQACEFYGISHLTELLVTLNGSTGAAKGHPLLTNPTFCDEQSVDVEYLGYKYNAEYSASSRVVYSHAYGDGKLVTDSVPYTMRDCDALPYAPTFAASADSEAPGAAAALTAVITQDNNEATTKKVRVEFPKGMGVNIKSALKPCSASDLAAKSCPEVSKMGTVEAESRLLPKREFLGDSVKPEDEVLRGNVYLTGQEGNKLTLSAQLSGFVDLRLDATAGVEPDGTVTATFDNIPSVPMSKFTLNLFGGDKGLLTNPRKCGTHTTSATFTSHSGKAHTVTSTSKVSGCDKPTFDVDLSEPGKGKRTGIELEVRSDQKPIKELKFGLDRHMKLSTKSLGKKRKFGEVSVTSSSGTQEAALKRPLGIKQKKKKAFSLKVSALKGLGVNVYRKRFTRKGVKTFKNKKNKKALKKKTVPKNRVSVKSLPSDDTTKVTISLNPDELKLLRNPKGKCRVNFIALIKTTDGTKYALKQTLKLRGKGCSKKKAKKKVKKKK